MINKIKNSYSFSLPNYVNLHSSTLNLCNMCEFQAQVRDYACIFNLNNIPPKPHKFVNLPLRSSIGELNEVMLKITEMLPQFAEFINQFNTIIISNNINIIIDSEGHMSLDVPVTMTDRDTDLYSKRLGILDRLIHTRIQDIDILIQKGFSLEGNLKQDGVTSGFSQQILDKANEFQKLKNSYKC